MQVSLQGLSSADEGNAVVIETSSHDKIQTLISPFCTQKGIPYSSKYVVFDDKRKPIPLHSTLQAAGIKNGENLYIGYRKSGPEKHKLALCIAIIGLAIGIIGILIVSLVHGFTGGVIPFDFGVVIDAGSSKTKPLQYQWLGNKYKGTGRVKQINECKVDGGIAKKDDPNQAITEIISCIKKMMEPVDEHKHAATPLYFASTAGMRLLNLSDSNKVDLILKGLRQRLGETGLDVKKISIISGRDEGIYAWTTANFLMNKLEAENTDPWTPVTYGALDLGGASTQISFALPPCKRTEENPHVVPMHLYGEIHHVFARSYLCYGRDEAARRYHALLVKNGQYTIEDPCAPKGFVETITVEKLLEQPCTQSIISQNFTEPDGSHKKRNFTIMGTSDFKSCKENVANIMETATCMAKGFQECFEPLPREVENQKFLAFANFYYTTDYIQLINKSLEEYEKLVEKYCNKELSQLTGTNKFRTQYCFNAVYIHELLVSGYGFNKTTWKNVNFAGMIDDKEINWSLGLMINATNMVPAKKPSQPLISSSGLSVYLVLLVIAITVLIAFIVYTVLKRRKEKNTQASAQSLYDNA